MRLRVLSLYGDLRHVPPTGGRRRFGVPPGGPFDRTSAALAAALVRAPSQAGIELAFGEVTFAVEEGGTLAIVGGGRADRVPLAPGGTLTIAPLGGARLALAAPGGWTLPPVGRDPESSFALPAGSVLDSPTAEIGVVARLFVPPPAEVTELRVTAGPQRALWTGGTDLTVTPLLDRRGVRLRGAPEHAYDLPSEPCVPGVLQWTPNGELIALGPDGPTIGGYPKPFVAIGADLSRIGQLRPGGRVRLIEVDLQRAQELEHDQNAELARRLMMIRLAG